MPTYEYRCEKCNKSISKVMSMAEHEKGEIICPECKGEKMVPLYSTFFAKTSKKS